MNVIYEQLMKKILDFWNEHDGEDLDYNIVRETFSYEELITILYGYSFRYSYYNICSNFIEKIKNIDNLFTQSEAKEIIDSMGPKPELYKYLDDETLLSIVSEERYNQINYIAKNLSSDEAKIRGFNKVKDPHLKAIFVKSFDSDELKLKYLRKISSEDRSMVIASLKDERIIEQYIRFFSRRKGDIIIGLSSDEKKIHYLNKYFKLLTDDDKIQAISSLKNKDQIIYYLNFCNDNVKIEVAIKLKNDYELIEKIIIMIERKEKVAKLLEVCYDHIQIVTKYIDLVTNTKDLVKIIEQLEDKYKIMFLDRISDKEKIKIIKEIADPISRMKSFKYINDKNLVFHLIEHTEEFPEYVDEYEYIVDIYSSKYNLDKQRLILIIKNTSISILKIIQNDNIIKILNASQESFMKLMEFFDINKLSMDSSAMNDILNAILQRKFRIDFPEIILVFPNMINAIQNENKKVLIEYINKISKNIVMSEISQTNWSFEQFIDLLMQKNEAAIECLHRISTKFITQERNKYIQKNLKKLQEEVSIVKYDKDDLMKYMISNYPTELILSLFFSIDYDYIDDSYNLTDEEKTFLENVDLLKKTILYKKNPESYLQIPEDVKKNIRFFNSLFEKTVARLPIEALSDVNIDRKVYTFKSINKEFLTNILMCIDIEKLEKSLFSNPDLLSKLMKFWEQYKIGGWGDTFNLVLANAGINIDAETIASFIQYFGLSYDNLQEKVEKGIIPNISLTALLDLAFCYSTESEKYSIIFGDENFRYISSNPGPNASAMKKEDRIERALELLKTIKKRKFVTVPPIDQNFTLKSGKKINIVVGNFSNEINLTYGERTGSCMRIGGAGSSLFDFCLEDENGFHIRFSDPNTGKFISRVSGFRNGNTVFLNQLRFSVDGNYDNDDIIEACKIISDELIRLSKDSDFPIENVVISTGFAMEKSGVQTTNLGISSPQEGIKNRFYTDVTSQAIIISTSDEHNNFVPIKFGNSDVPRYPVVRDKKRPFYNDECRKYVAHLKSLDQVLSGNKIDGIDVSVDETLVACLAGEDWCVTIDKDGKLDIYIMENSNNRQKAIAEAQEALEYFRQNLDNEIEKSKMIR